MSDAVPEGWVELGPRIRRDTLAAIDAALPRSLRQTMADAGFQYRQARGIDRVIIRGDPSKRLFYALPLQRADGSLRSDAAERLHRNSVQLDLDVSELMHRQPGFDPNWRPTVWTRMWLELIDARDPVGVLESWLEQEHRLRFHRLVSTIALAGRSLFLRHLDGIITGADPSILPAGDNRPETARTEGLLEVGAAQLLAPALMARYQPLAAVLTTSGAAQVAVTIHEGHFVRPLTWDEWPVGMAQVSLEGPGRGLYRSEAEFPPGWSTDFLHKTVEATDRFLRVMTDPARWRRLDGRYDDATRRLTWASVVYGLDAISDMARAWTASHTLWDAFRALGTLQGIWEGGRQGAVGLPRLLDPRLLRDLALGTFPDDRHRRWANDIVSNYQEALLALSPGQDLDDAIVRLAEIRHLLHGVQAQGRRPPMTRFEILEHMDRSEPDVQLLRDIAAFWWTALIFTPDRFCRPGVPPWD